MQSVSIRLLLIDDDLRLGELLRGYLEPQGVALEQAASGEAGLGTIGGGFDAVLLDVMMPGKSGWEVARALKQDPVTQGIKIVMVTAIGESVNELTSPLYGADAHLDKPFEFEKLEKIISTLVKSMS